MSRSIALKWLLPSLLLSATAFGVLQENKQARTYKSSPFTAPDGSGWSLLTRHRPDGNADEFVVMKTTTGEAYSIRFCKLGDGSSRLIALSMTAAPEPDDLSIISVDIGADGSYDFRWSAPISDPRMLTADRDEVFSKVMATVGENEAWSDVQIEKVDLDAGLFRVTDSESTFEYDWSAGRWKRSATTPG